MDVKYEDIVEYIKTNGTDYENHLKTLSELYEIDETTIYGQAQKYTLSLLLKRVISQHNEWIQTLERRKKQVSFLKNLSLPDQRTPEWYEMRRKVLTASSLADALGKGHFKSRDETLYGKIVEQPYEQNPITQWGVKYEEVATRYYEELYNVKIHEFGLVPHPKFPIFGASPDGICDDTGNDEYTGRMLEIKCPPKRKFTKTVPPHYLQQVLGQLEVCDLDECDFFQVKIEEYESWEDYVKDTFLIDDTFIQGRTFDNHPKGAIVTYKVGETLSYNYGPMNLKDKELQEWIDQQPKENQYETKYWKVTRYETTLVKRDHQWWNEIQEHILEFFKDLEYYKQGNNQEILQKRILESKKRKKRSFDNEPLVDFQLISDEEDNQTQ